MISLLTSRRSGNLIGFLACAGLLGFAYFLQFYRDLQPCPLCILQRLVMAALGVVFLVAAIHHPAKRWAAHFYGVLFALLATTGASIAGRHVWIQHTPENLRPACGPGLEYLVNNFAPFEALQRILRGSGECGAVDWTFLTLSIPEWTLIVFVLLAGYAIFLSFRK